MKRELKSAEHSITVYEPESGNDYPIIYMHASDEKETDAIWELLGKKDLILVCIQGIDWNKYMSPWPAKRVFKDGDDFAGKADVYIETLTNIIVPEVENTIIFEITKRGLIGYSLSGLFALYTLYKTDIFSLIGSMSGSLWFNGWIEYIQGSSLKAWPDKIYLSLGDKESKTRNELMATVEDHTKQTKEIFKALDINILFEMNPGNHFTDIASRIAKGIKWLI